MSGENHEDGEAKTLGDAGRASRKPSRKAVKTRRTLERGAALLQVVAAEGLKRETRGRAVDPAASVASGREAVRDPSPQPASASDPRPPPSEGRVTRVRRIVQDAVAHFLNDEALMTAAALAFTLILALFPFLIFITALASVLGGEQLAAGVSAGLFDVLPADIASALQPQVRRVIETRSGGFLTFGLVVTIFSLTTAIESIRAGLNRAYGVREMRNVLITRAESLLFVLVGSLTLLLVAFLAVAAPLLYGRFEDYAPDLVPWRSIFDLARLAVMGVILMGALLALHVALPAHRRGLRQVYIGALVTLGLWYAAGLGFSYYLANFGNYAATYAGLAGVVAALMFFYIASACLLFGGEVNRAIAASRRRRALERRRGA